MKQPTEFELMAGCILYGGNRFRSVYHDDRVEIVRCVSCGLVRQADYAKTLSEMSEDFQSVERYYQTRHSYYDSELTFDPKKVALTSDIRYEIDQRIGSEGKILDVGCGRGEFLTSLKETGLALFGVEPDPVLASLVQEREGIQTVTSMYEDSLFPPGYFDAITFIQVVELLQYPLKALSVAYMHLRPSGLLVIDVPGFNNPRIIAYRLTRVASFVQRDFIPSHSYYFTRRTLSQLVERAGFDVLKAQTGRYSVKFDDNPLTNALDWFANAMGIGGITLYAQKA